MSFIFHTEFPEYFPDTGTLSYLNIDIVEPYYCQKISIYDQIIPNTKGILLRGSGDHECPSTG